MSETSDQSRGSAVKEIFLEASELPAGERAAFLDQRCGPDVGLRRAVESLLSAEELAGQFLGEPTGGGPRVAAAERTGHIPRQMIGPYKLLELIGEGGFGAVYLAEQETPVRRRVALKLIKLGMDTNQVIARFEAERQALAIMDHPNIARVFDAGATENGRPYFVMELVRGNPITLYCDHARLTTKQRLDLFIPVCKAVQHAHQKGIIHRDIKPSNILVTMHDGKPVPKIIDFGVAKATQARLTERTLFTEFRQMIGTPEYMSPEQAEMSGLDVDTRSDVYSLGVVLYELLTGAPPFDPRELRSKAYEEMQRMIREVDPPRPSTRLSTLETLPNVAAHRSTEPKKLSATIRGELDWIVMKCLEKDRTRRYDSASALANDISQHLNDGPVSASPASASYRVRKFVRRHRGPVAASAIVVVVLVAGIVGTTVGLIGQSQQRREAERQAHEAARQASIAQAVAEFQTDMLGSADPEKMLGDKVTVLQAATAAITELDAGKLKDQPLVEAGVRQMVGVTLLGLGRYKEAEPQLRRALDLRRAALSANNPLTADAMNNLAVLLRIARVLPEAESLHREALRVRRLASPIDEGAVAESLNNLAIVLMDQRKLSEAETLHREALVVRRRLRAPDDLAVAKGLSYLGALLFDSDRYTEAEPLFRESVAIRRRVQRAGHPETAIAINNLANALYAQGKHADAEPLFLEALEIRRNTLPAGHSLLADNLNDVAGMLRGQGKFAEAEPLVREALQIYRNSLSPSHPDVANGATNLAILLAAQGKHAEAEPLFREAVQTFATADGKDHWRVGVVRLLHAQTLMQLGRRADAEGELIEAARVNHISPDADPHRYTETIESLVALYDGWNNAEPTRGYDARAREWKAKLPAPTTKPSTRSSS